jgi:ribokinase
MRQVICIGSACKDIFFPTNEGKVIETPEDLLSQKKITFELGAKYKIDNRAEAIGGVAANVAVGMARLGLSVACYSHIGDDANSDWVQEQLRANGVDTSLITREKNCPSDLSAIIVDRDSGERVIFSNQKANSRLEINSENLSESEWFFVGDLHGKWEDDLDKIYSIAREKNVKVANNPRQVNIHDNPKKILEMISSTQALFLNKDEAIELLSNLSQNFSAGNLNDEVFLIRELRELGPEVVVITDGLRGAWATDGTRLVFAPGIKVAAADTTGAGDSFTSAFFSAYIKGKRLDECVQWGIVNSSNEVQFYGSIEGLLSESEILEKTKSVKVMDLKS